ncbi:ornithine racemase Orr [Vallitalea okinawensis]|uniref:ornithine racemase Orr n=1 Tax=Vallitalea okinawensis TaxID=2078660 RepID=UPI000CFC0749|nr:ornithine racemase Orr [Vallitalea okinawensis]
MSYPQVVIDLNKLRHNTSYLVDLCHQKSIQVAGVSKVFCADPKMVKVMMDNGIDYIADSRIDNLRKIKDFKVPKILLRLPMISEVDEVVRYSDISLNSEVVTIEALNSAAKLAKCMHEIILMCDIGDLREGIFDKTELINTIRSVLQMENIKLVGLGTNITCYGGVIPTPEVLGKLVTIKEKVENTFNLQLNIISGGNSSSIELLKKGEMPKAINHLRLGESIILGRETAFGNPISNTFDDCMLLKAEIIELKEKPSVPIGEIGMDAFGKVPEFVDKGIRKRAICAVGKQDVDLADIIPIDKWVDILGGSSDHLIVDVTDSKRDYKVGDIMTFKLTYGSILSLMTSAYVDVQYI